MLDVGALTTSTPRSVAVVDVDVVEPDAGAGDDLEFRRGVEHLGVDGGRRANQNCVGFGHRCQQLLAVRAVDPAHLNLVTQGFDSRFGKFVSDKNNRQAHAASLVGIDQRPGAGRRASQSPL